MESGEAMVKRTLVVLALLAVLAVRPAAAGWGETYTLANGLRVILSPDQRFPSLTVLVRYHVGARQEPSGRSGIAHLVEHLTYTVPRPSTQGFVEASQFTFSSGNGATSFEHTDYYTTTPRGNLKYGLWAERWRMGLSVGDVGEIERQRQLDVVRNERRERLDTAPYSAGRHLLWSALFPEGHPFHEEVIGSMRDLGAITLADARNFFRGWYVPRNATLTVVGDFDPQVARSLIQDYYGPLPSAPLPDPPPARAQALESERVIRHDERYGKLPRLEMAWHSPALYAQEDAVADVTAQILGGLHSSRLFRAIPTGSAVAAFQQSLYAGSVFHVVVIPSTAAPLETLQSRVDVALDLLREHAPAAEEVENAVRALMRRRVIALEDSLDKALLLTEIVTGGDETAYVNPLMYEESRYRKVTPAAVQAFVRKYLVRDKRVVLYSTPQGTP
jgi:predicted Zn-dependent peptidase